MNRIYQGRVTAVEIPAGKEEVWGHGRDNAQKAQKGVEIADGKDEQGRPLEIDVLWRHHELFQDVVNF